MNKNWARWIFASISKHFRDYAILNNIPMFIEGQRRSSDEVNDYAEFRFDGPVMQEVSRAYWNIDIDINILIVSYINEEDLHKIHRNAGIIASAFTCIPIMKYGDGIDDNALSQLMIMDIVQNVTITNFGQISPDSRMLQMTVEGQYNSKLYVG